MMFNSCFFQQFQTPFGNNSQIVPPIIFPNFPPLTQSFYPQILYYYNINQHLAYPFGDHSFANLSLQGSSLASSNSKNSAPQLQPTVTSLKPSTSSQQTVESSENQIHQSKEKLEIQKTKEKLSKYRKLRKSSKAFPQNHRTSQTAKKSCIKISHLTQMKRISIPCKRYLVYPQTVSRLKRIQHEKKSSVNLTDRQKNQIKLSELRNIQTQIMIGSPFQAELPEFGIHDYRNWVQLKREQLRLRLQLTLLKKMLIV